MSTEPIGNPVQEKEEMSVPLQEDKGDDIPENQEMPKAEAPETDTELIKDSTKALELKEMGNQSFKIQDTNQALDYYEQALAFCPDSDTSLRLVLYSNIAICYSKHKDYESVVEFTTKALSIDCSHQKSLLNRSSAYESLDKPEEALEDYKKLLTVDGKKDEGLIRGKIYELERKVEELTEKRKTEVLDGLKKLGNSFLGYFGMNLDNFKMEKNENGSYNISVKK